MMSHVMFVALSYGISAVVFAILIIAIIWDGKRQKKQLAKLESLGLSRRGQKAKQ